MPIKYDLSKSPRFNYLTSELKEPTDIDGILSKASLWASIDVEILYIERKINSLTKELEGDFSKVELVLDKNSDGVKLVFNCDRFKGDL